MSLFDPHGLYRKTSYYTNKGQIIRQKDIDRPGIIKQSEIPRSLQVLKTYGYTVFPPGYTPDPQTKFQNSTFTRTFPLDTESLSFSFSLSTLWPTISSSFSDILQYDPSKVTVHYIYFGLIDITLAVNCNSSTTLQPLFYNNSTLLEFPLLTASNLGGKFSYFLRVPGYIIAPWETISSYYSLQIPDSFPQTFISYFRCDESYSQLKYNDIEDDFFLFDLQLNQVLRSSSTMNYVNLNFDVFISLDVSD